MLQFQLKDLAMYYKDRHDLVEQKLSSRDDDRGQEETVTEKRPRQRGRGERSDRRERGGKPRRRMKIW
jgi:ATP-dependent RNA helicase DeaD